MTQRQDAYMGEFYQDKPSININTVVTYFVARPVTFRPTSAIIQKEVQFPDVSFWQEEINYGIMCMQTDAIIIRAGQNLWEDDQFERNYLEAKKCGLKVGVYWFYDGRVSPSDQARILVSLLAGKKLELEVYIDWEHNYGGQHEGLRNVVAMMELVENAGLDINGVGLYTGFYFFTGNSNPVANASQYNYLKQRPLWLAWYTDNAANVRIPAPWSALTLWQWGTPAWDWGQVTREIDMNYFNGTSEEFEDKYGEVDEGEPPMADYVKLSSNTSLGRTIRKQTAYPIVPHIMGDGTGSLPSGRIAKALPIGRYTYASDIFYQGVKRAQQGDVWWKVYEVDGQPLEGWVAEKHMGQVLLNVDEVDETPEPVPTLPTFNIQFTDTEGKYPTLNIEWKPNE